jgi:hypothetical protein
MKERLDVVSEGSLPRTRNVPDMIPAVPAVQRRAWRLAMRSLVSARTACLVSGNDTA